MIETLSDKKRFPNLYLEEDVKKFIKDLKDNIKDLEVETANETGIMDMNKVLIDGECVRKEIIDKLAGDKLT